MQKFILAVFLLLFSVFTFSSGLKQDINPFPTTYIHCVDNKQRAFMTFLGGFGDNGLQLRIVNEAGVIINKNYDLLEFQIESLVMPSQNKKKIISVLRNVDSGYPIQTELMVARRNIESFIDEMSGFVSFKGKIYNVENCRFGKY